MEFFVVLAVLFFIFREVVGLLGAAIITSMLLIGWTVITRRVFTTGLIKSDIDTYFDARSKGAEHGEAMGRVIEHRYPFSQERRSEVKAMFDDMPLRGDEQEHLKLLVYVISCHQAGRLPTPTRNDKILRKIDRVIQPSQHLLDTNKWKHPKSKDWQSQSGFYGHTEAERGLGEIEKPGERGPHNTSIQEGRGRKHG